MRPIVAGSGYYIASVSIGCSRLILSLHSWAESQKEREKTSNSEAQRKHLTGSVPRSRPPSYELKMHKLPDVELGQSPACTGESSQSDVPPPVPPKDYKFHSILPDIERPSLPERMSSTLPGTHVH
ncbi:hypothetical protein RhiJN_02056 [Ceratobasidium sp. AG-Ba]|nr:hypothetical protein RhiJN_02056 [Ceratobasidium sp. AG-Ba]